MNYSKIYIFVEGNDDERFFKKLMVPLLSKKHTDIEIFKYAQWKKDKINLFLQSIQTLNFHYIFTADIDTLPSVNSKKRLIRNNYPLINDSQIAIVVAEIESWYYAGAPSPMISYYGLDEIHNTNSLTKELFNDIYKRKFSSRIDFMNELLKNYSIEEARERNSSFDFFCNTFIDS